MNKCIFIGRTTADIELKQTAEWMVANFSLAVSTGYGNRKKTSFLNCVAWNKTAETLQKYAPKGTKLMIEAQAEQQKYTDRNGQNVSKIIFNVQSFEFCESKAKQETPPPAPDGVPEFVTVSEEEEAGLPFV